ncbi:MAG: hypothetical protein ACF8PG_11920 [Maioricimonas sp. JB045]
MLRPANNLFENRRPPVRLGLILAVLLPATPFVLGGDSPPAGRTNANSSPPAVRREQVTQLVDQLASPSRSVRVIAERSLRELGPAILPWLPTAREFEDPQVRETVERLRNTLEQQQAKESVLPSTVTLQGTFALVDLLEQIAASTSNPIDTDNLPDMLRQREVSVAFERTPFWKAILSLADEHGLRPVYSEDTGALRLEPAESDSMEQPVHAEAGAVLVQVWPVTQRKRPGPAGRQLLEIRIDLLLEPRLHAVFLHYRLDDFTLTGPDVASISPFTPGASYERPLTGGVAATLRERFVASSPVTGQHLRFDGRLTLRTAAIQETFRFPVANVPRRKRLDRGGVTAQLLSAKWSDTPDGTTALKAHMAIAYDETGPEFESHRAGRLYQNAWLESGTDGRRQSAEVGLLRQLDRGAELELSVERVNRDDGPLTIIYQAPRQFLDLPVSFELEGIPVAEQE